MKKAKRTKLAASTGSARKRKPKHKMARFPGGWNYRGYCVYSKPKGTAGAHWQMHDESGDEWGWFFHTLAEFRRTCDRWERQRAREAARAESSPNTQPSGR